VIVDARGKRCPVPVIELAKALPTVAVGEVVEVLADDPAARVDIPVWCRMKGQRYDGADDRDGATAYRVTRLS
jgi:TusA-related sulfurtransferase